MASKKKQQQRTLNHMKSGRGEIDKNKFLEIWKAAGGKDRNEGKGIHTLIFNDHSTKMVLTNTVQLSRLSIEMQCTINNMEIK